MRRLKDIFQFLGLGRVSKSLLPSLIGAGSSRCVAPSEPIFRVLLHPCTAPGKSAPVDFLIFFAPCFGDCGQAHVFSAGAASVVVECGTICLPDPPPPDICHPEITVADICSAYQIIILTYPQP